MSPRTRRAVAVAVALGVVVASAPALADPAPEPPPASADKQKDAAREQFDRGVRLVRENALSAALAAFLKSRELFPTRAATSDAAWCLRKLERYDESLDMYETLLREFKNLPADERAAAQQAIAELRELVGTVEVQGGVPGAAIAIDGKDRGEYPAVDALRVAAGAHVVRLFKEGYEPFETTVDVAGGQTVRVRAHLARLAASGRLSIVERTGKHLDVVLDDVRVGATPWEGTVSVGPHTVVLRGQGGVGTQPVRVPVRAETTTPLTLAAEELGASLLVQVAPPGATVALDGVTVGRGLWDGRLRAGPHRVEVGAEGFLPARRDLTLATGERRTLSVELERDPSSRLWRLPSKVVFDASIAFDVAPTLGGDVAGGCGDGCSRAPALGLHALLHAGYELPGGFGVGLALGYLRLSESVTKRATTVRPVGLPDEPGTADDALETSGLLVGAAASYHFGARFPVTLRLGAGLFGGNARDERQGTFSRPTTGTKSASESIAPALVSTTARAIYVDPEVRVATKLGDGFEIGAGLEVLALFSLSRPVWGDKKLVNLTASGVGTFGETALLGDAFVSFAPGADVRYAF
ncbi:MAG TPA: PEGA domain-containing protein [Minicystis sp.]|nr:PEGA domain-containing protein [Minicystis sp.]